VSKPSAGDEFLQRCEHDQAASVACPRCGSGLIVTAMRDADWPSSITAIGAWRPARVVELSGPSRHYRRAGFAGSWRSAGHEHQVSTFESFIAATFFFGTLCIWLAPS